MKIITPAENILKIGSITIYPEKIKILAKSACSETATLNSGIFTRPVGARPMEITVSGHFAPSELSRQLEIIDTISDAYSFYDPAAASANITLNNAAFGNIVLYESYVRLDSDRFLWEYFIRFGGESV